MAADSLSHWWQLKWLSTLFVALVVLPRLRWGVEQRRIRTLYHRPPQEQDATDKVYISLPPFAEAPT
jgi:hypothetical protein